VLSGCGVGGWNGLGSSSSIWAGWTVVSLPFYCGCGRCFFFSFCLCLPHSLRSLHSCVCSPVCALSLSLYSFFCVSILPLFCSLDHVLSLLHRASRSFLLFHLHRLLPPPDVVLSLCPFAPPQIAGLLHTVHVFSSEV
jgi:hypothetical protein